MMANKAASIGVSIGLVCSVTGLSPAPGAQPPPRITKDFPLQDSNFTVAWWRRSNHDERSGFLFGSLDCLENVFHKRLNWNGNIIDVFNRADAAFMSNIREDIPAGEVIEHVTAGAHKSKGRLDYEGSWGPGSDSWRRGLVAGYITCNERHGRKFWYNPVEYYVYILDMMYDPDRRYGDDQYDGLVSDVLDKFGYPPPAPSWTGGPSHFILVPVYPEIPLD